MFIYEVWVRRIGYKVGNLERMFYFTTEEEAMRFLPVAKKRYDTLFVYCNPVRVYKSIEEMEKEES